MTQQDFSAYGELPDTVSITAQQSPDLPWCVELQIEGDGFYSFINLNEGDVKALRNWLTQWIAREGPDA